MYTNSQSYFWYTMLNFILNEKKLITFNLVEPPLMKFHTQDNVHIYTRKVFLLPIVTKSSSLNAIRQVAAQRLSLRNLHVTFNSCGGNWSWKPKLILFYRTQTITSESLGTMASIIGRMHSIGCCPSASIFKKYRIILFGHCLALYLWSRPIQRYMDI